MYSNSSLQFASDVSSNGPTPRRARRNQRQSLRWRSSRRRGIVALWVILLLPVLMLMLFFVSDAGKMWIARVELENALEAAALAGVRTWGQGGGGPTATARGVAIEYAAVNLVDGQSLVLASNLNVGNAPNENDTLIGNLVFGSATQTGTNWTFNPAVAPNCGANRSYAIRAQATAPVTSFCNGFLGLPFGPYEVAAETTAIYQCNINTPRLVATAP